MRKPRRFSRFRAKSDETKRAVRRTNAAAGLPPDKEVLMDFTQEIFARATQMMGGGADDEGALLVAMCKAAGSELVSRLKDDVETESIRELFVTAAGILALSMYIELDNDISGSYENIKVGNVSVSRSSSGGEEKFSAVKLRRQAEHMLAMYLRDSGFDFRGVRG